MLQDLSYGSFDNQYHHILPQRDSIAVCFRKNEVLLARSEDGTLSLPRVEQISSRCGSWEQWLDEPFRYAFTMQDRQFFLWLGAAGDWEDDGLTYLSIAALRKPEVKDLCFGVMTAWHLYCWYRDNRFCGRCGQPTVHDDKERMMRCPTCRNMIFPRIAPAAIIAVTHGDRLLINSLTRNGSTLYGLLAGFIEIGETAEEAVVREVMEEVGLKVKNVRYYKSQPWGIVGNLSVGYFCDLDGDDETVTLDRQEISEVQWFNREDIPTKDEGISLTSEMIRIFQEGNEPKA